MHKLCELLCAMCYFGPVIIVGVMGMFTSKIFSFLESDSSVKWFLLHWSDFVQGLLEIFYKAFIFISYFPNIVARSIL